VNAVVDIECLGARSVEKRKVGRGAFDEFAVDDAEPCGPGSRFPAKGIAGHCGGRKIPESQRLG
jgi:hypothetical protein